jgi:diadenosine tetraphosphatase ApaH/serine/threonine PP2A family protein phosphatase
MLYLQDLDGGKYYIIGLEKRLIMVYGLISDIHANYHALEAVLASMDEYGVDRKVCLGDLVGYGGDPETCVQRIRRECDLVILGNHDSVASGLESDRHFNHFAQQAIDWTRAQLSDDSISYLRKLPYMESENDLCFVHSSPRSPAEWIYVNSLDEVADAFEFFSEKACFVGHTHNPVMVSWSSSESFEVMEGQVYTMKEGERLLVNVGSVGQPRDRNVKASWCIFDTELNKAGLIRVPYDIEGAQNQMRKNGLPEFLIQRLEEGR